MRGIAILTVTDDHDADDSAGAVVTARVRETGHPIVAQTTLARSEVRIEVQINTWLADPEIGVIIVTGTTDRSDMSTEGHGSTLLFSLSGSLMAIAEAFDRVVLPQLANRDRLTTSSISVIGDLATPQIDLRGGKRGLVLLTMAGMAAAAALGAVTVDAIQRNQELATSHHAAAPTVEADETTLPPPPPTTAPAVKAPVVAKPQAHPAPAVGAKRVHPAPRVAKIVPAKPVVVPAALETKPAFEQCSEESCAASNNERECCAPYRVQTTKLERTMISPVLASLRSKVLDCRETEREGLVRLTVDVAPDGHVTKAMVLESPEASVGRCVAEVLRGAQFRVTEHGGSFAYRIDLAER